tara:strand:+ start:11266 stop:11877 length:612 start_codon:yes stop_codon:yes gene_type:complete
MNKFENDPGTKNILPLDNNGEFDIDAYLELLKLNINTNNENINSCKDLLLETIKSNGKIIFCGNGGSFGIASHLSCDFGKGLKRFYKNIRVVCLGCNQPLFTALSNDYGFENALSSELEMLGIENDLLIAISSSGRSLNISNCIKQAKKQKIKTIGLSGFDGGDLKQNSDIPIHFNVKNYPLVELLHQNFLDLLCLSLFKSKK